MIDVEVFWEPDPEIYVPQKRPYLICPECKTKTIVTIFEVAEDSYHMCNNCDQILHVKGFKDVE